LDTGIGRTRTKVYYRTCYLTIFANFIIIP